VKRSVHHFEVKVRYQNPNPCAATGCEHVDRAISRNSGRNERSTLRLLSVVASDLRLCNHHHQPLLLHTRLHHPPTQTRYNHTCSRPHHDNLHLVHHISNALQSCDARHHDAPTSRPTTQLRSPSDCLAPLSDQAGASRIYILRPLLCTPLTKSPNSATTSVIATPGNAPDIISQDRVDKCASTGQYRPTRGGRWDAGGKRARRAC
jgi:hypothetical protein